jgi:lysophospholipase L1-like esterase
MNRPTSPSTRSNGGERPGRSSSGTRFSRCQLFLIRLGLVIGTPVIFLVVVEFALRMATTGSFYLTEKNPHFLGRDGTVRLVPNTRTWWYGQDYQINSNGFRMTHEVGPKHGLRILGLGDSVTVGMGVTRTGDVWPNWLETIAHQRGLTNLDVINSGVQGWNLLIANKTNVIPAEYTRFVEEVAPKLEPDLIVYCVSLNDVPSVIDDTFVMDNARNRARFKLFPESAREWFKRKAFYRLARDGYREARFHKLDFSPLLTVPESDSFWAQVAEELGRLKRATESLHAKLCCVIVPYSYQLLPANKKLLDVNQRWHRALEQNHIPWVDLTSSFNETTVMDYYALGDYCHLNTKGHHLIAEEAFNLIQDELRQHGSP